MEHLPASIAGFAVAAATSWANVIVAGLLMMVVVVVCLRLLPDIRPANRFIVWGVTFVATISLYFIPLAHKETPLAADFAEHRGLHLDSRLGLVIVAIWLVIAFARIFRIAHSAMQIRRIAKKAKPVPSEAFTSLLRSGRRKIELCLSEEIDSPCVIGFLRPRVLIPEKIYIKLSNMELEQIIMHEVGHISRHDDWSNLLQKISLAIFPLNPVIAWLENKLCVERELACDECVLNATSARKQYAFCLTNLAEHAMIRRNLSLSLGAWGRRSELAYRVQRILNKPKYAIGKKTGYAITAMLIAGMLTVGATLSKVPALVSFSAPLSAVSASLSASSSGEKAFSAHNLQRSMTGNQQAMPVLVKAVMPQERGNPVVRQHRIRRATKNQKANRSSRVPEPGSLLLRTDFDEQFTPPHIVLTIDKTTGSSYAALPLGNGWLVVQL